MAPGGGESTPAELELGRVVGIFGVRGELRLHLHHRESTLLAEGREVVLISPEGERRSGHLSTRSGAGRRVLGKLCGLDDRDEARELMGWRILIDRSALPEPEPGSFYVWAVRGLPVLVGERSIGEVVEVHSPGGGADVLEVRTPAGPVFLPLLREVVREIDVAGGRVVVAPDAVDSP